MKRRGLLKLGAVAAVVIGLAGGSLALLNPGLADGRLSPSARALMRSVALAVFDGLWPGEEPARDAALAQHLTLLDTSIASLPAAVRAELSQVLALLTSSGGRLALVGLTSDWASAPSADVQQAMNAMRLSGSDTRQQIYRALRDLNCVVFFSNPAHWALAGYPGPREIA